MKKSLVIFVALCLAAGVLNCGGSDSSERDSSQDEVIVEDEGRSKQAAEESADTEPLAIPTPDQREEELTDKDDASISEIEEDEEEEEEIIPQVEEVPAVLVPGYGLPISGSGFAPNSLVEIWLYSDPIQLGEFLTDEQGNLSAEIEIPESVPLGDHTLEMEGEDVSGEPVTVSTPVIVGRDTEPPTLSSVSLSTGSIDVSNGERTVTVTISASDEKLGVNSALFKFSGEECSEEGGYLEVRWPYLDWPGGVIAQKVSGTNNNGTWQATVTVPSYTPSCTIALTRYVVCDIVGNCIEGDAPELGISQPLLVVTNSNYIPDTEAPILTGLSFSTNSLDVSSGAKNVTVTVSGTDNRVGITSGLFKFSGSGCSTQGGYLEVRWPYLDWPGGVLAQRVEGTNRDGTWRGTVTIPSYIPPCTIGLDRAVLCDNANNCAEWTSASTPVQAPTLTVINSSYVPDTSPPSITGLSFSTTAVDVSSNSASVTLTINANDAGLGIRAGNFTFSGNGCDTGGYMEFRWPTLDWPGGVIAQRISGTNTNGTWQGTVTIPTYTPPCTITFQQGVLCDTAGNCSDWDPNTVPVSTPSIVVTNSNIEAAPIPPGGYSCQITVTGVDQFVEGENQQIIVQVSVNFMDSGGAGTLDFNITNHGGAYSYQAPVSDGIVQGPDGMADYVVYVVETGATAGTAYEWWFEYITSVQPGGQEVTCSTDGTGVVAASGVSNGNTTCSITAGSPNSGTLEQQVTNRVNSENPEALLIEISLPDGGGFSDVDGTFVYSITPGLPDTSVNQNIQEDDSSTRLIQTNFPQIPEATNWTATYSFTGNEMASTGGQTTCSVSFDGYKM